LPILDFGFKKENNVSALIISEQSRKLYFEVFGEALNNNQGGDDEPTEKRPQDCGKGS
jgi:hypothetical protein